MRCGVGLLRWLRPSARDRGYPSNRAEDVGSSPSYRGGEPGFAVRRACGRAAAAYGERVDEFRARLRLLTSEEGGRSGPLVSGYRSLFDLGDKTAAGDVLPWGGEITLHGVNELAPGGEAVITVRLLMATHDPLSPGWTFRLFEGKRLVGHGELL